MRAGRSRDARCRAAITAFARAPPSASVRRPISFAKHSSRGRIHAMSTMRRTALLSLAVWWAALGSPANAQDAEKAFYAGKTVRMIVGSGVGGGYDVFSRLIAPYLAKTLGTTVIVENQPGAGGLVALNRLAVAPPDGLQISLTNGTGRAFAHPPT